MTPVPVTCGFCERKFAPATSHPHDGFYCPRCLALRQVLRWLARFSVRKLHKAVA